MFRFLKNNHVYEILFSLLIMAGFSIGQIPVKIPKSIVNPFGKDDPLTSSLADAVTEIKFLDGFDPQNIQPLSIVPYEAGNGFLVREPGGYVFLSQSYCLKAGAYGPGSGKGYLYAPLKGPNAGIITNILRRSVSRPEIAQRDIQLLLWAIIAKTRPSKMNSGLAETTRLLLTPEEIARLEGSAFEEVSNSLFRRALGKLPRQTQRILESERMLRDGFTGRMLPFSEVERIAVLAGEPLASKDDRAVPSGRWSYHPDGYFIRYFPNGYSETRIEVYYPGQFVIGKDTLGRITSISRQKGEKLEVEYDDTVSPLEIKKESSLKGYAFKSVRLIFNFPSYENLNADLGSTELAEWTDTGWAFSGDVKGKGKISQTATRYYGARQRYDSAVSEKKDLQKLAENLKALEANIDKAETENLFGLMQFAAALKDMFTDRGIDAEQQFFDPIEFAQRAWASEFAKSAGTGGVGKYVRTGLLLRYSSFIASLKPELISPGRLLSGGLSFDGGAAMPGQTGRQRLGTSDRPQEPDNRCADAYKKCKDDAFNEYMRCSAKCIGVDMPDEPTKQQLDQARMCVIECEKRLRADRRDCSTIAQDCLEK